jgi:uncharacterized protein involved in tolerance to divalent cations
MTYYKLEISAEDQAQADAILGSLLDKKLVTGGQFIATPSRFLWKGKVIDQPYVTVTSFTIDRHKAAIIESVRHTSAEEVPMVVFLPFEGNSELLKWIEETVAP